MPCARLLRATFSREAILMGRHRFLYIFRTSQVWSGGLTVPVCIFTEAKRPLIPDCML
jgi:hypothetical protein